MFESLWAHHFSYKAPSFNSARYNYAVLLHRRNDPAQALVEIERLLVADPGSPSYRNLCAIILSRIGEYQRSGEMYAQLLAEYPATAKVWLRYGHVLKSIGSLIWEQQSRAVANRCYPAPKEMSGAAV